MYIIKNACLSLSRSKGRTILIGIIVLVIATACCVGLSIRQAAETAKEETLSGITITASISYDRTSMMTNIASSGGEGSGSFDKDAFSEAISSVSSLSAEELSEYAELDSVSSFYYTVSVSFNGDDIDPVGGSSSDDDEETESDGTDTDEDSDEVSDNYTDIPDGIGDMKGGMMGFEVGTMGTEGDFTVIGYSSDEAMTSFISGTSTIISADTDTDSEYDSSYYGTMFDEGTEELTCVISYELAVYNSLTVGDTISIANPNDEEETYTLTIVGIYINSQSTVTDSSVISGFSSSTDSSNQIYMSAAALEAILSESEENATVYTDTETETETTTALPSQISGTYVFASVDDYETFCTDVYEAGLSEDYTVSSSDLTSYESSLVPLENLSTMALYFLIVVIAIGAVVLIVLNIFNVRERKYEVGVLTAIGMKKSRVSLQFMCETLIVTIISVVVGGLIGAVSSVPITNSLLASQIESQSTQTEEINASFGREMGGRSDMADMGGEVPSDVGNADADGGERSGFMGALDSFSSATTNYVSEVSSATNLTVLAELLLIAVLLTLIASAASVIFIMRYDSLKILANRD
ncbi:MAG: FtsX-like permease family protein [Firmicutes bacterium]|nr:FtsX-like permease family protein [Bacillota bacterium]